MARYVLKSLVTLTLSIVACPLGAIAQQTSERVTDGSGTNGDNKTVAPERTVPSPQQLEAAEAGAREALVGFYDAFNRGDNEALQEFCNYPHAFVGAGGSIRVIDDRWEMNFQRLRQRENWHHSSLDAARAFLVKPDKVHFELVFSRHNTDGTRYSTVRGLWIMTKQNGNWGLSLRSY